jgi:hypothetical protein
MFMKKNFFLFTLCPACLLVGLVNGCKKDSSISPPTNIGTATSFTEEFEDVHKLDGKGWVITDNGLNTPPGSSGFSGTAAPWSQGRQAGVGSEFSAYSYTTSPDEFASATVWGIGNYSISSWLITPVLSVKNGDKISFYSRADSTGFYKDRMQVLMNKSASALVGETLNSVGGFTTILLDINSSQVAGGYPVTWTKYEYIFSGISGKIDTRIGFRYFGIYTTNTRGIGIDLFRFQVN